MDEFSLNIDNNNDDDHEDDDDDDEDWDIGLSSTCCSKQTPLQHPSEINNDDEETEEEYNDDYGEDDDDDEDYDDDDDYDDNHRAADDDRDKLELGCPYCTENLDILGLCCHIDDQHYKEANSGICPICAKRLETSMTVHIIGQHEIFLRDLSKQKVRGGGIHTNLSLSKKEEYSRSHLKAASSRVEPSYDLSPDLALLSFIQNSKQSYRPEIVRAVSPIALSGKSTNDDNEERSSEPSPLTDKLHDKARVCEFVNGLLFSTIFDEGSEIL